MTMNEITILAIIIASALCGFGIGYYWLKNAVETANEATKYYKDLGMDYQNQTMNHHIENDKLKTLNTQLAETNQNLASRVKQHEIEQKTKEAVIKEGNRLNKNLHEINDGMAYNLREKERIQGKLIDEKEIAQNNLKAVLESHYELKRQYSSLESELKVERSKSAFLESLSLDNAKALEKCKESKRKIKFTKADIENMQRMRRRGYSNVKIAKHFGVSDETIRLRLKELDK